MRVSKWRKDSDGFQFDAVDFQVVVIGILTALLVVGLLRQYWLLPAQAQSSAIEGEASQSTSQTNETANNKADDQADDQANDQADSKDTDKASALVSNDYAADLKSFEGIFNGSNAQRISIDEYFPMRGDIAGKASDGSSLTVNEVVYFKTTVSDDESGLTFPATIVGTKVTTPLVERANNEPPYGEQLKSSQLILNNQYTFQAMVLDKNVDQLSVFFDPTALEPNQEIVWFVHVGEVEGDITSAYYRYLIDTGSDQLIPAYLVSGSAEGQ